jgi:hypothetical protein
MVNAILRPEAGEFSGWGRGNAEAETGEGGEAAEISVGGGTV